MRDARYRTTFLILTGTRTENSKGDGCGEQIQEERQDKRYGRREEKRIQREREMKRTLRLR